MRQSIRLQSIVAVLWTVFALQMSVSFAADITNTPPAGSGFVVKDNTGVTDRFRVQETGAVTIPGLPGGTTSNTLTCFDSATGRLGPCAPGVGAGQITKSLTLSVPGSTALASWKVAPGDAAGGTIDYTIVATDGGTQIVSEHGRIQFNATTNSITCTVDATDKLHLGTVNSGCTPGFFSPGLQPGVSIFDNVAFPTSAPIVTHTIYFEIHNNSISPMRLEP
jgi:hypothetical protein